MSVAKNNSGLELVLRLSQLCKLVYKEGNFFFIPSKLHFINLYFDRFVVVGVDKIKIKNNWEVERTALKELQ